jgi:hypothetical protein
MDPTEAELQERLDMLAYGVTPAAIAVRFGRAPGSIANWASIHKDRVAARREQLLGIVQVKTAELWITDQVKSHEVREALAEDTIERRADPDLPARDVSRYNRDIDMLIHRSHELAGMLPQRVQAQVEYSRATNCISGFSCECGKGCDQVKPWPRAEAQPGKAPEPVNDEPEQTPEPAAPGEVPERWAGKKRVSAAVQDTKRVEVRQTIR